MKKKVAVLTILILFFSVISTFAQIGTIDLNQLTENENGIVFFKGTPYTGTCFENHSNNSKGIDGSFKDGKKEGIWYWYYETGQKKRESNFKAGKLHGVSTTWYKNGQKRSEIIYEMGKSELSKQQRWDNNGKLMPPALL
ncbi:MAG TPA: hypothetical protein DDX39_12490 [Bacteroidales bacterium]|nr:MAG: hypothetical protein A2265_03640 [Bacteroidetes bacterium RIFOXYA12_FULL_33_9]HBF89451.1 hypothetical protein [Bacteroidales bacterium]